jgi:hypothetical protein
MEVAGKFGKGPERRVWETDFHGNRRRVRQQPFVQHPPHFSCGFSPFKQTSAGFHSGWGIDRHSGGFVEPTDSVVISWMSYPLVRFAIPIALTLACVPGRSAPRGAVPASAVAPARLEALSRAYLGVPYRLDCLGEGRAPDSDPLHTRKYADCQTLVEQVMAEALAPHVGGLDAAGKLVRYHGARVRLEDRYHYCVPDWLRNPWPARDITEIVGGTTLKTVTRRLDRPALLKRRGGNPGLSPVPAETVTARYIPRGSVPQLATRIPTGSIAVFVSSNPAVVAGHVGFVFHRNGQVMLRHASQRQKKVVDQSLTGFLAAAPKSFLGLMVLRPDITGLRR